MSQKEFINVLTPVGRIISGSCHEANKEDAQGRPLIVKSGPNAGQPRESYGIGLAVPKTQQDWKFEAWAAPLLQAAQRDFPQLFSAPGQLANPAQKFAWKITDGDSQIPNSNGNKPCDMEGAPGNWVIWLNNGFAPKLYKWDTQKNQAVPLAPGEEVKRGYYAEAFGSVSGNNSLGDQSGIYVNLTMVCMRAFGNEIVSGPSVEQAGFGGGALPQGASAAPTAGTTQVNPSAIPQASTPPPPATDLMNGPGGADVPPPPPATVELLSYNGGPGKTREQWITAGWSEAQIKQYCIKV